MAEEPNNAQRLLAWKVPDTRQHYSRRDTAFYALSIGAGSDPLDPGQLRQVDPWAPDMASLPSMALILGYPGFWLGTPEISAQCGVKGSQVLHVEQSVELMGPLPVEATVIGETRITGLVDKGKDKGSLLLSERHIRLADGERAVAICRQIHLLRGFGGFGHFGVGLPAKASPAQGPAVAQLQTVTRPEQALAYRLNGDNNKLHSDPAVAQSAGFDRPILHGMCTVGLVVRAATQMLLGGDPAQVRSFTTRMVSPVYPGDVLQTEAWADGSFRASVPQRQITVLEGRVN